MTILSKIAVVAAMEKVRPTPELHEAESELRALAAKRAAAQTEIAVKTEQLNFPRFNKPLTRAEEVTLRTRIGELTAELKILDAATSSARRTVSISGIAAYTSRAKPTRSGIS